MRPDVVPSAPVESAGRSVVGEIVALRGPQRPLGRAPGRQQQAWRGPVLTRLTATGEARHGW
jgi:hypothetical protein